MLKKIGYALLAVFIILQFIRPEKNISEVPSENDIRVKYHVPSDVLAILKRSCYDCHSNNTEYPWYANIQPVGWWLKDHVDEGKDELDFSEFGTYSAKKADHKLDEVIELIEDKEMPLESYLIMHGDAELSEDEAAAVITWAKELRTQLKQQI